MYYAIIITNMIVVFFFAVWELNRVNYMWPSQNKSYKEIKDKREVQCAKVQFDSRTDIRYF